MELDKILSHKGGHIPGINKYKMYQEFTVDDINNIESDEMKICILLLSSKLQREIKVNNRLYYQFEEISKRAYEANKSIDYYLWFLDKFGESFIYIYDVLRDIIEFGNIDYLEEFIRILPLKYRLNNITDKIYIYACEYNNDEIINWAINKELHPHDHTMEYLGYYNKVDAILKNGTGIIFGLRGAIAAGNIDTLNILINHIDKKTIYHHSKILYSRAISKNNINSLKWLDQNNIPHSGLILNTEIDDMSKDIFDWVIKNEILWINLPIRILLAIKHHRNELFKKYYDGYNKNIYECILLSGNIELLQWINNKENINKTKNDVYIGMKYNHSQMVSWMIKNGWPLPFDQSMYKIFESIYNRANAANAEN